VTGVQKKRGEKLTKKTFILLRFLDPFQVGENEEAKRLKMIVGRSVA